MNLIPNIFVRAVGATVCGLAAVLSIAGAAQTRTHLSLGEIEAELASPESALRSMIANLERSLPGGDGRVFDAFVQRDWLLDRATTLPANRSDDELRAAFRDGTRQSWKDRSLAEDYLGTHFRFLRAHTLGGRAGLLFRSSGDRGSLNYCLLTLAREPDGPPGVDDIFVVGLSEFVSETLRRGYVLLVDSLDPSEPAGRKAETYIECLPKIIEINSALRRRDFRRALALSQPLPESVRNERGLLLMRLEAAEQVSLPERAMVMAQWRAQFPDEETLPLKFADFHIAQGRLADAEQLLRNLDERLGGDSYLKLRIGEVRALQRRASRSPERPLPGDSPPAVTVGGSPAAR